MAISLKHLFQSAKTDGPDNTIVQPSDWNDEHVLTQATGKLLGRTTAGTGATEEIAPGTGITLSAGTLSADVTSVAGRTGAVTLSTADISGLTTGYVQKTSATGSAYLPAGTTGQREGSPAAGYIRYNTTTGKFEGYGSAWGNIGGGAAIGDTPPSNPGAGDLWWNSADGRMYVYYTDANSSQWVDLSAGGAGQYLPLTGGTVTGNLEYTGTLTGGTGDFTTVAGAGFGVRIRPPSGSASPALLQFTNNPVTAQWASITSPSANILTFNDGGGVERMRIDASGRVTKPFQPTFYVRSNIQYDRTGVGDATLVYTAVSRDVGNNYSTSTGRFTAPVSGTYLVQWSILGRGGQECRVFLIYNGAGQLGSISQGTSWTNSAGFTYIYLNANDWISMGLSGGTYAHGDAFWGGWGTQLVS